MKETLAALALAIGTLVLPAAAHDPLKIKPLAERKVSSLPEGTLYWRIESVASAEQGRSLAGPHSLVAESDGKVWLFTLGAAGGATAGATKVAEVGPIPRVTAPEYLLRINEATGASGSVTPIHTHPGSEAFFVLKGEQSIRGPRGVMRVSVGQPEAGAGADTPMEVSSSGPQPLHSLVMFVVDATRPFSSPATMP